MHLSLLITVKKDSERRSTMNSMTVIQFSLTEICMYSNMNEFACKIVSNMVDHSL